MRLIVQKRRATIEDFRVNNDLAVDDHCEMAAASNNVFVVPLADWLLRKSVFASTIPQSQPLVCHGRPVQSLIHKLNLSHSDKSRVAGLRGRIPIPLSAPAESL